MTGMKRKASALVDETASAEAKASMAADSKTSAKAATVTKAGIESKASVAMGAKAPASTGAEGRADIDAGAIVENHVAAGMADAGRSKAPAVEELRAKAPAGEAGANAPSGEGGKTEPGADEVPLRTRHALLSSLALLEEGDVRAFLASQILASDAVASAFRERHPVPSLDWTCVICQVRYDERFNTRPVCKVACECEQAFEKGECPRCGKGDAEECGPCRNSYCDGAQCCGRWLGDEMEGEVSFCYRGPHVASRKDIPEQIDELFE